jgi:hypothetical protein
MTRDHRGGMILEEMAATGAVALMPRGMPVPTDVMRVAVAGGLTLPLYVRWRAGGRRISGSVAGRGRCSHIVVLMLAQTRL